MRLCTKTRFIMLSSALRAIPFHSIPFHSIPFHSILFYSSLVYSILFYSVHRSIARASSPTSTHPIARRMRVYSARITERHRSDYLPLIKNAYSMPARAKLQFRPPQLRINSLMQLNFFALVNCCLRNQKCFVNNLKLPIYIYIYKIRF